MDDFVSIWDHSYSLLDGSITVAIHEDLDAGLGGTLFDGSVALSSLIETIAKEKGLDYFKDKSFLELGAGCGFPGLFAGKLGSRVVLTDVDGPAIALLEENIELNKLVSKVEAKALDWFSPKHLDDVCSEKFDFVLAADTIYSTEAVEPFLKVCARICSENPKAEILFAHPRARVPDASAKFWSDVVANFTVEKVSPERFVREWKQGESKQFLNEKQGVFILRKQAK
jgi:SAM-dependent methyltransferase